MAKDKQTGQETEQREAVPSALDDRTHAEMRLLYEESAQAILFAKAQQWKTVGATLVVFLTLVVLVRIVSSGASFVRSLVFAIIVVAAAAILILVIYQFWQHTELLKLDAVGKTFSSVFNQVRSIKSRTEANVHRYTLLLFMIAIVLLGAYLAYVSISTLAG